MWINEIHWNGLISILFPETLIKNLQSIRLRSTVVKSVCIVRVHGDRKREKERDNVEQKLWLIAFENAKILMTMWWIENSSKVVLFHFITIGVHWRWIWRKLRSMTMLFQREPNVNTRTMCVPRSIFWHGPSSPNLYQLCQFNFMRSSFIWPTKLTFDHEINASDIKWRKCI